MHSRQQSVELQDLETDQREEELTPCYLDNSKYENISYQTKYFHEKIKKYTTQ